MCLQSPGNDTNTTQNSFVLIIKVTLFYLMLIRFDDSLEITTVPRILEAEVDCAHVGRQNLAFTDICLQFYI